MFNKILSTLFFIVLIIAAIILFPAPFIARMTTQRLFSYGGYYLILALFLFWIITIIKCAIHYRPTVKDFFKRYGWGVFFCLIVTAVIFLSVKCYFRILSDETNLIAVSKSMTYERRTDNVTMGKWYYDNFYPINREMPKRPLLFPFLIHIVNIVLGYRPENAFILNFIILFSLLFLIYALVKKRMGTIWAVSAVLLVASQPVVSQTATSGGFDLLSALFVVICLASLEWFLKEPSAIRFQFLWVNLLMVSNVRYEGILYFIICMSGLLFLQYLKPDFLKTPMRILYFSTPLILLPLSWPRVLVRDEFETKGIAFSVVYIIKNIKAFLKIFFDFKFSLPYAAVVNLIGLLALLWFGYLFLTSRISKERYKRHFVIISGIGIFVNLLLFMTFHTAVADHPSVSRYYLLFCIMLSILALTALNRHNLTRQKPALVLIFSILMFMLYHPISIEDRFSRMQTLPREYRFVSAFLKKEAKKDRSFLVITTRPGQYTVYDYGAVNFEYAKRNKGIIREYKNHLYRDIFVIQEIEYKTLKPTKETTLNNLFILETLAESQKDAKCFTRISRVVFKPHVVLSSRALPLCALRFKKVSKFFLTNTNFMVYL